MVAQRLCCILIIPRPVRRADEHRLEHGLGAVFLIDRNGVSARSAMST